MDSELQGRLRNTQLPYHAALVPLFEAVVNSIQSIEEKCDLSGENFAQQRVDVTIIREKHGELPMGGGRKSEGAILEFEISDTGVGFTNNNWNSFNKLDSLWKIEKGCRGIGRLMWLKAFSKVEINSVFSDSGRVMRRHFVFDVSYDKDKTPVLASGTPPLKTTIRLCSFEQKYAAHAPKTLATISMALLEHILWYFVRDAGCPEICLREEGGESLSLFDLLDQHMSRSTKAEDFYIKDTKFTITHCKFRLTKSKNHSLGYCADGRLVKEENIKGKIPGLTSSISDAEGEFSYTGYITGSFLDERVYEQRVGFNIDDELPTLLESTDITFKDIREGVIPLIKAFLGDSLTSNVVAGKERLNDFVANSAPGYRPILSYIPEEDLAVDPSISDKDLDLLLHKHAYKIEQNLLDEGHDLMAPKLGEKEGDYHQRLEMYLQTAADLKQSDLAKYVMHRKVVIDLLSAAIVKKGDGKYVREDLVHSLIVPMQITSDDILFKRQNLWLLDERLAFHDYLASDIPLSAQPITENKTGKEPDVSCLQIYNNPILVSEKQSNPHASITVIEIKRPMREDMRVTEDEKDNPILQSLNYLKRLREGAKTKNGRIIQNATALPGYIYVVADLTKKMIECCEEYDLTVTSDGAGYFGYHRNRNAYIQVISFDGLVTSAKERNRAFFQHLGLPAN